MTDTALHRAVGALLPGLVLAGALTGCGSGPGATTCGELSALSVEERVHLLGDLLAETGSAADRQAYDALPAAERTSAAEDFRALCSGAEDDTRIQDLDGTSS